MGRRLNLSTPTVISTELMPLDESFYIEADGQLEQWYYDNTSEYSPNRTVTPLVLTPHLSLFDGDTKQSYTPVLGGARWFEKSWDVTEGDYVETEITNTVDSSSAEYVKVGNTLRVKKNVTYSHAVTIRCVQPYSDPRDNSFAYSISATVLLSTNRDATVIYPTLDIDAPTAQSYNPLTDASSQFALKAQANWAKTFVTDIMKYEVDALGTESVQPMNDTDIVTAAPSLDLRYGALEQSDQMFQLRQTAGGASFEGNVGVINGIKGNSVKFNQLYSLNIYSDYRSPVNFGTLTVVNGHLESSSMGTLGIRVRTVKELGLDSTHKYILSSDVYFETTGNTCSFAQGIIETTSAVIPPVEQTPNKWVHLAQIWSNINSTNYYHFYADNNGDANTKITIKNIMLFDLTLMFGAGNEPATVADFESWLAQNVGLKDYYPYNAGELLPVRMTGMKTIGFNQWDEVWERGTLNINNGMNVKSSTAIRSKNYIRILPDTRYNIRGTGGSPRVCFYDRNKSFISEIHSSSAQFTPPSNTYYIRFATYSSYGATYLNNICVNIFDSSKNGTYEPYWEKLASVPVTTLKGKLNGQGESVVVFPDGMKKVGSVYDEIYIENGVTKAIKRVGSVDMGSITWRYLEDRPTFDSPNNALPNIERAGISNIYRVLCGIYNTLPTTSLPASGNTLSKDMSIAQWANTDRVIIRNDAYTDAATFKTAMSGVMLYYVLATPEVYVLDPLPRGEFEWYGIQNNAEVKVETLPWYVSGQNTDTLTVDAMYGESIRVVLRARGEAMADLFPNKVYRTIDWRTPDIDTHVVSRNGGAVRGDTDSMDFTTIVNVLKGVLSDAKKAEHLRFNWKTRRGNQSTETDAGWGDLVNIPASQLRNSYVNQHLASTLVFPYVYLKGAYEGVTDNGEAVTDDGEQVIDRPIAD